MFQSFSLMIKAILISIVGDIKIVVPFFAAQGQIAWWQVLFASVLGNSISAIFLLTLLVLLSDFLRRKFSFWDKFFTNLFEKTKLKHKKNFEKWGVLAVLLAAAIPLPGFGGWTAAIVSFVFGIKFKKAVLFIILGIFLEAVIMTLLSFGIKNIF
ncbi:MAG: small multi-drug export protein [Patescibacteria group bacterium]|jgi:uncharacterized membrane protein